MKKIIFSVFLVLLAFLSFTSNVSAHEAYVLTAEEFSGGLALFNQNPFGPLIEPTYRLAFVAIFIAVAISYGLVILWSASSWAEKLDSIVKKARPTGPLIIRLAISASFFFAGQINCVLGPEISLTNINGGIFIRYLVFLISVMIFLGVYVEFAAFLALLIFLYIFTHVGVYMLTYANYFGEILVLMFFGSKFLSFDQLFFGKRSILPIFENFKELHIPIVRVFYGIALIFAGVDVKFFHEALTISVYNQYHLDKFFHAGAAFISAGAGLSEITIGIFILLGFAMRFTILISLVFITLSLLYFHEMLWPHLMLYGISFSLFINSADKFTIDHYLPGLTKKILGTVFRKN